MLRPYMRLATRTGEEERRRVEEEWKRAEPVVLNRMVVGRRRVVGVHTLVV